MNTFADRLFSQVRRLGNPTVMGLDPLLAYLPDSIVSASQTWYADPAEAAAMAILAFNRRLIDATSDLIPAVKLQSAYYEMYGHHGIRVFADTIAYAHAKGMLVIADCKRNDIGSTAEAYATAYLGKTRLPDGRLNAMFDADALTVNAYLGSDGIEPFIRWCESDRKGIFILVRTSNPSAGDLQDLVLQDGDRVYEKMGDHVSAWGRQLIGTSGFSPVGAVVGATWPEQAAALRVRMPGVPFLVPGYGAQGGTASDICSSFNADGMGAIVNASRSLICAYQRREDKDKESFEAATRAEAIRMRDEIREALAAAGKPILTSNRASAGKGRT